jgi:hypothetical protein
LRIHLSSHGVDRRRVTHQAHTETFISRGMKNIQLGKRTEFADFAKDIKHGKVIGADSSSGVYHGKSGVVSADVSV